MELRRRTNRKGRQSPDEERVWFAGEMVLALDRNGQGRGLLRGEVDINVRDCKATFSITDVINEVKYLRNGNLHLESTSFVRHVEGKIKGKCSQRDAIKGELPKRTRFTMTLRPSSSGTLRTLTGTHQAKVGPDTYSSGEVEAKKEVDR